MTSTLLETVARRSPLVLFSPFLVLFGIFVARFHTDQMFGDETRYYEFAQNLIRGFYSPAPPDINLWSGPGYSLFLVPFVYFGTPLIAITLCNAVFQYLSVVLLYLAVRQYVSFRSALIISVFWALYYISYQEMPSILAETFSLFLCSTFVYLFTRGLKEQRPGYAVAAGAIFGLLVLTKIVFGYVLILLVVVSFLHYAGKGVSRREVLATFLMASALNVPYLAYTHALTSKWFYWGNSGGSQLYWMSSPYEGEFGDWNNSRFDANCLPGSIMPCHADLLARNHQADIATISALPVIEQDDAYRQVAFRNIRSRPLKYIRNWVANIGRLFFGFPASYVFQREQTVWRLPLNCVLLSLMVFALFLTVPNWRRLPIEVKYLCIVLFSYLGLSSLVSAYPRHLYVVVPIILLWCGYVMYNTVTLTVRMTSSLEHGGCAAEGGPR